MDVLSHIPRAAAQTYALRRVDCPCCGVKVECLPWAMGKHPLTEAYAWFLARWAKRLSWREVAEAFQMSWEAVFGAVEMAVLWGRAHVDLSGIHSLGIDELAWGRGHRYLTMVYQIDAQCKRLLWVGEKRTVKTLLRFFRWLGKERSAGPRFICSDMWKPYLKVIAKKAGQAIHVLDRFHIMAHLSKAIDEVRAKASSGWRRGSRRRGRPPPEYGRFPPGLPRHGASGSRWCGRHSGRPVRNLELPYPRRWYWLRRQGGR